MNGKFGCLGEGEGAGGHKWIDKSKTTFHHWSRKFLTRNFHQAFPLQTPSALLVNKIGFLKMINSVIEVWDFIFVMKEIIEFRQKLKIIIIDALNGPWWPNDQIGFVRER